MTSLAAPNDAPAADPKPGVPGLGSSLAGLWVLSWRGFFAWRRAPLWLAALVANPLLAWLSLPDGESTGFLHWNVHLYVGLLMPLYCLVVCGAMIRDEVQDDTLAFLVTRPLTRARLYLGKYVCQVAWLQFVFLVNGLLLLGVGLLRDIPEAPSLAGRVVLAGVLAALVYGALGGVFGLLTRRYIVLGLVYGFIVEVGIGHIPTNINSLSMLRHLQDLLAGHPAVRDRYDWSAEASGTGVLIILGTTLAALVVGAVLFTWKEFHASHEALK